MVSFGELAAVTTGGGGVLTVVVAALDLGAGVSSFSSPDDSSRKGLFGAFFADGGRFRGGSDLCAAVSAGGDDVGSGLSLRLLTDDSASLNRDVSLSSPEPNKPPSARSATGLLALSIKRASLSTFLKKLVIRAFGRGFVFDAGALDGRPFAGLRGVLALDFAGAMLLWLLVVFVRIGDGEHGKRQGRKGHPVPSKCFARCHVIFVLHLTNQIQANDGGSNMNQLLMVPET